MPLLRGPEIIGLIIIGMVVLIIFLGWMDQKRL